MDNPPISKIPTSPPSHDGHPLPLASTPTGEMNGKPLADLTHTIGLEKKPEALPKTQFETIIRLILKNGRQHT